MTIRPATPEDGERAAAWSWSRGVVMNPAVLPPIGVVCEDERGPCGAVWLYCSASNGVAFVEFLTTRPLLTLAEAVATGKALMAGAEAAAKSLGYNLLVAYCLEACARYLRALGWESNDARSKIAMTKTLL